MIRLERFERSDFARLINWVDSEDSMVRFSGPIFSYPITDEQLEKYINAGNRLVYKAIHTGLGEVVGHAELNNIDHKNKSARICRVLVGDKHHRNKGFGRMIIKELVRVGFSDLQLHRLDLGVFDFNHQAIKCYRDCGFEIEGLLKDTTKMGNEYWSVYNMSIINNG
ncbi:MAG: GNAT family protein [Breznakibacter sp.]